jgi:hypothetical protein
MRTRHGCEAHRANREAVVGLALLRYQFATPEIRTLMRIVLGHAVSGRTLKRVVRASGRRMTRGRPPSTPRIHKGELSDLIELTSNGLETAGGNALQLFEEVQIQFDLAPRQYLMWVAKFVRRGKYMMRRCLLCSEIFCSLESTDRHCRSCRGDRRRLVNEERCSSYLE